MIRPSITASLLLAVTLTSFPTLAAAAAPTSQPITQPLTTFEEVLPYHPAADALRTLFPATPALVSADFKPTALTKRDYLDLISSSVKYFRTLQNEAGAIIDPYEKAEKQYSTPCFAHAAAILVDKAGQKDLIEPASRALTFAINALANKTTADKHPDFYIPSISEAIRLLRPHVAPDVYNGWAKTLSSVVPEKTYVDARGNTNWNTVNVAGEVMRQKVGGLVAPELQAAHDAYIEKCLTKQQDHALTKYGLYWDGPIVPLAYDAFSRLWWEEMLAAGYAGPSKTAIENFLTLGGLSTLLLQSPNGEWATGGRSAQHQWNECEIAVICENNANRWKARGREDIAGAFKRAARLALSSVQRWKTPDGDIYIVKNRASPEKRHGYEGYGFRTNYGLLPMAMLAMAYERADDSIQERPTPSEIGGYVFDVRDIFHKVAASAGGYYALVETASDAHYNATGLQRVQRVGTPLSPLSDSAAAHRWYHPKEDKTMLALTPSLAWKGAAADEWHSLPQFVRFKPGLDSKGKVLPKPKQFVESVDLQASPPTAPGQTAFTLTYNLQGAGAAQVTETYTLSNDGVTVTSRVAAPAGALVRVQFPALVNDGANDTQITKDGNRISIAAIGGKLDYEVVSPANVILSLDGPRVPTHNGYIQAAAGTLPEGVREATWRFRLSPAP